MKRSKMLGVGKGYTIVEALIFLAVSGALLISAGSIISGRQERTRFSQSIDELGQNLQDIFNDVSTGYYPSAGNFTCSGSNALGLTITNISREQGTNSQCVFVGKLVEFPLNQPRHTSYTMVSTTDATSFVGSKVKLLGQGSPGIFDTVEHQVDLKTTKIFVKSGIGGADVGIKSVLIVSDFGTNTSGAISGNASKPRLWGYKVDATEDLIPTNAGLVQISGDSSVVICLEQDATNLSKKGSITISPQLTLDRKTGSQETGC